jgi:hypothetical protein
VREAEDLCDIQGRVTEDIAIANEARLRSIGFQRLSNVFAGIFNSSQRDNGEAVRELAEIQAQRQNLTSDLVACQVGREVYEFDGLDGLETDTLWRNKDPVGWFPPPEELTDS